MQEIAVVPPQELGILTPFYKKIVPNFKHSPLKSLLFLVFLVFTGISAILNPCFEGELSCHERFI